MDARTRPGSCDTTKKASFKFFALVASLLLGVARASTSALATRREDEDSTVSIYLISFIHVAALGALPVATAQRTEYSAMSASTADLFSSSLISLVWSKAPLHYVHTRANVRVFVRACAKC